MEKAVFINQILYLMVINVQGNLKKKNVIEKFQTCTEVDNCVMNHHGTMSQL